MKNGQLKSRLQIYINIYIYTRFQISSVLRKHNCFKFLLLNTSTVFIQSLAIKEPCVAICNVLFYIYMNKFSSSHFSILDFNPMESLKQRLKKAIKFRSIPYKVVVFRNKNVKDRMFKFIFYNDDERHASSLLQKNCQHTRGNKRTTSTFRNISICRRS